ncbi:MAG: Dyp-type peroxidase [Myxococcota bacterium]
MTSLHPDATTGDFTSDVQANVLRGLRARHARFVFVRFDDAAGARAWLGDQDLTDGQLWPRGQPPSEVLSTVAISSDGMRALGVDDSLVEGFPEAFRAGMWERRATLGDPPTLDAWDRDLRDKVGRQPHALLSLYADDEAKLEDAVHRRALLSGASVRRVHVEKGRRLVEGREHFGFRDGISQPVWTEQMKWRSRYPLSRLLCFPPSGGDPTLRRLLRLGSYLVFRKIEQDVAEFRRFVQGRRFTPENVAALMMGRWRNGAPVELFPDDPGELLHDHNDFEFDDEASPGRTAQSAHIRRSNPRRVTTEERRIVRRGIPYGEPVSGFPGSLDEEVPANDEGSRGLLFIALNADLEGQFEFIQRRWMNSMSFGGGWGRDPFGASTPGPRGRIRIPGLPEKELPTFTRFRGGAYFFMPSMQAIRDLSDNRFA